MRRWLLLLTLAGAVLLALARTDHRAARGQDAYPPPQAATPAQSAPAVVPQLIPPYGVGGVGTCGGAFGATSITSDPPGRVEAIEGALIACWPAPPRWFVAAGPGGSVRWPGDPPPPTPIVPTPTPPVLVPRSVLIWVVK